MNASIENTPPKNSDWTWKFAKKHKNEDIFCLNSIISNFHAWRPQNFSSSWMLRYKTLVHLRLNLLWYASYLPLRLFCTVKKDTCNQVMPNKSKSKNDRFIFTLQTKILRRKFQWNRDSIDRREKSARRIGYWVNSLLKIEIELNRHCKRYLDTAQGQRTFAQYRKRKREKNKEKLQHLSNRF